MTHQQALPFASFEHQPETGFESPHLDLALRIVRLGAQANKRARVRLGDLYSTAVAPLGPDERMKILLGVCEILQRVHAAAQPVDSIGGTEALLPFVFRDSSPAIVSTAALESAAQMPLKGGDPLSGPRVVLATAAGCAGWRRGAILRGLLLLGDEPTVRLIYGCWRELDEEGRAVLATPQATLPTHAIARFYVGWLQEAVEHPEERGVGTLAGTLAAFASEAAGIVSLSRTFPGWAAADGQAVKILETWTFPEYAEMAASTLEAIASRESSPRTCSADPPGLAQSPYPLRTCGEDRAYDLARPAVLLSSRNGTGNDQQHSSPVPRGADTGSHDRARGTEHHATAWR